MAKRQEEFELDIPFVDCFKACKKAAITLNWRVDKESEPDGCLICEQVTSWFQPVQAEISLYEIHLNPNKTKVVIEGYQYGFGPLVTRFVSGEIGKLRSKLESMTLENDTNLAPESGTLASEIEKLAELRERGLLTNDEFEQAKSRLLNS